MNNDYTEAEAQFLAELAQQFQDIFPDMAQPNAVFGGAPKEVKSPIGGVTAHPTGLGVVVLRRICGSRMVVNFPLEVRRRACEILMEDSALARARVEPRSGGIQLELPLHVRWGVSAEQAAEEGVATLVTLSGLLEGRLAEAYEQWQSEGGVQSEFRDFPKPVHIIARNGLEVRDFMEMLEGRNLLGSKQLRLAKEAGSVGALTLRQFIAQAPRIPKRLFFSTPLEKVVPLGGAGSAAPRFQWETVVVLQMGEYKGTAFCCGSVSLVFANPVLPHLASVVGGHVTVNGFDTSTSDEDGASFGLDEILDLEVADPDKVNVDVPVWVEWEGVRLELRGWEEQ